MLSLEGSFCSSQIRYRKLVSHRPDPPHRYTMQAPHGGGGGIVVVLVLLLQIFTVLEILSKVEALGLLFFFLNIKSIVTLEQTCHVTIIAQD